MIIAASIRMIIILAGLTATETFPLLSLMCDPDFRYNLKMC